MENTKGWPDIPYNGQRFPTREEIEQAVEERKWAGTVTPVWRDMPPESLVQHRAAKENTTPEVIEEKFRTGELVWSHVEWVFTPPDPTDPATEVTSRWGGEQ
jgi:hypothetical protein